MGIKNSVIKNRFITDPKYRKDIDGLRGVSVIAVVIFHVFPNFIGGGFVGVDIFFVISGYVISKIIFENLDKETFNFFNFLSRRIIRIFPSLLITLLFCIIFGWFYLFVDEYKHLNVHIGSASISILNFVLWNEAGGYFDNSSQTKPLLHLWSLAIEGQFYVLWPLLLLLAWKLKFNLLKIIIILITASFILNFNVFKFDTVTNFYSPFSRFWEFLIGSLTAWIMLYKKESNIKYTLDNISSFLGIILLIYGFLYINKNSNYVDKLVLIPILGTALIIAAGPNTFVNKTILSNKIIVWLGLISFPLYLYHWPLFSFTRIVGGEQLSEGIRLSIILFSIVLAHITYKFIENPIRFRNNNRTKVFSLITSMVLIGYVSYNISFTSGLSFRKIAKQTQDFEYNPNIDGYLQCNFKDIVLNYCMISNTKNPNSIIIGDSHAKDKFHGLVNLDNKNNWMLLGHDSCPPVLGVSVEGDQKGCEEKFKFIIEFVSKNKNIKNVVLSFYGNYFKNEAYAADHLKNKFGPDNIKFSSSTFIGNKNNLFYNGLNSAIKKLTENEKLVTVFIDVPELPFFPKDCFRNILKKCVISKDEVMKRQMDFRYIVDRLKNSNPNLRIFDPIEMFCNKKECTYKKNDVILYRDSHHLTLRGSNLFAELFIKTR